MKHYKITEERLSELLRQERYSIALDNGGVDNWDWYSDSLVKFWQVEEGEE